jgi:hypothetical protein
MSSYQMRFVVVNDMAPHETSVCTTCLRSLEQSYLRDISNSKLYCGAECYPQRMVASGFAGSFAPANPIEFAMAWPMLTVDVASALFDGAWRGYSV